MSLKVDMNHDIIHKQHGFDRTSEKSSLRTIALKVLSIIGKFVFALSKLCETPQGGANELP